MGLYGNIVVEPRDPAYWPPVDREVVLVVDDVLLEDGQVAPYDRSGPDHVAMGRFGNVLLVNGQPTWSLDAQRGEVVRFYLTNTANTRIFNLAVKGAVMKLVGGDSGRYERETRVDDVLIAPSERAVVDVLFDQPGAVALEHRTPDRTYTLGTIHVGGEMASRAGERFHGLRRAPELEAERVRMRADLERAPDKVLALVAKMTMEASAPPPEVAGAAGPRFACPMDPEIVSMEPGRCPKCGMKLLPVEVVPAALERRHAAPAGHADAGGEPGAHGAGRLEWDDAMEAINRRTTTGNMRWMLVDRQTGQSNAEIDWSFAVGDRVKIRLVNERDSDHPMPHPFHVHGAGRFLILARDGEAESNLVWKDTVLVRTGEVVDMLLDVSNPGLWMAHCHISEHIENGMMLRFRVARPA
jgi:FtsP/CotA-like multicopper oxidase with cupredoxin domain